MIALKIHGFDINFKIMWFWLSVASMILENLIRESCCFHYSFSQGISHVVKCACGEEYRVWTDLCTWQNWKAWINSGNWCRWLEYMTCCWWQRRPTANAKDMKNFVSRYLFSNSNGGFVSMYIKSEDVKLAILLVMDYIYHFWSLLTFWVHMKRWKMASK